MIRDGADFRDVCETILHSGSDCCGLWDQIAWCGSQLCFPLTHPRPLSPQAFNLISLNLGLLICKLGMVEDSRKCGEGRIRGRHLAWLLHAVNKWLLGLFVFCGFFGFLVFFFAFFLIIIGGGDVITQKLLLLLEVNGFNLFVPSS